MVSKTIVFIRKWYRKHFMKIVKSNRRRAVKWYVESHDRGPKPFTVQRRMNFTFVMNESAICKNVTLRQTKIHKFINLFTLDLIWCYQTYEILIIKKYFHISTICTDLHKSPYKNEDLKNHMYRDMSNKTRHTQVYFLRRMQILHITEVCQKPSFFIFIAHLYCPCLPLYWIRVLWSLL